MSHCMAFSKSCRDLVVEQLEPIAPVTAKPMLKTAMLPKRP